MWEKRQAAQVSGPAVKAPRSRASALTRTIHQDVIAMATTVAGALSLGSPSASSAHPFRVQHASSLTPSLGYGLPPFAQLPA